MPRRRPRQIDASELLRDCERWATSLAWPAPIDRRLDDLVALAVDEGGENDQLSRAELVAALVLAAPSDGEELSKLVRRLRKAKAGEAVVKQLSGKDPNVIVLGERRPGRRSQGGQDE